MNPIKVEHLNLTVWTSITTKGHLMKYFPMSGVGWGEEAWLRDSLSPGRTALEKEELELREAWREREGRRNIREKNP